MIEPMIEPIFVILGILASVAIPRLAATREDAEISAAVANLRTLVSDASAYYVAKGSFNGATWNQITNVPLNPAANANAVSVANANGNNGTYLKVGGKNCIGVHLVNKNNAAGANIPAHIKFTKVTNGVNGSVCKQVQDSAPLQPYFTSTVTGTNGNGGPSAPITSAMAIGSNTKIH